MNTKKFKCNNCDKQYKYKSGLIKHISVCIKNPKPTNNIDDCNLEIEKLKAKNELEKLKTENKIQKLKDKNKNEIKLLKAKHKNTMAIKEQETKQLQSPTFNISNLDIDTQIYNVILPFILSHKCLNDYFEKSHTDLNIIDNIRTIITTTNDQMFNYHNKSIFFNDIQKKRIINKILKAYNFFHLQQSQQPNMIQ